MFIAVDLKVIEGLASAVARASGSEESRIGWGLVLLWHRCWADEVDELDRAELAGVFGLANLDATIAALVAFGFLAANESTWRVKGASRYLRLKESRRRGAAATNASKARSRASHNHALERGLSDAQSRSYTESPNTESPRVKKLAGKKPPADPRLTPLTVRLVAEYATIRNATYKHGGAKDASALKALLPVATDDEISRRWIQGLRAAGWASCSTFAQLAAKWNDLAAPASPVKGSVIHGQTPWGPDDDALAGLSGERS